MVPLIIVSVSDSEEPVSVWRMLLAIFVTNVQKTRPISCQAKVAPCVVAIQVVLPASSVLITGHASAILE